MTTERTDEELLDYWTLAMPEGMILVTEADALRIKTLVAENTISAHDEQGICRDSFVCPFHADLVDLFGAPTTVRLDQVGTITRINAEIRALSARQDKLLDPKKPEWE